MKILFQGDSITDAGRDYKNPHDLGNGYPKYCAAGLKRAFPGAEILDLGISGNRTTDLVRRWTKDCINIQPDLVSILIGINDTWRAFDRNDPTSVEDFENNYRTILQRTKEETNAKILILEPFLVDTDESKFCFRADLSEKIDATRRLAREYADAFIPLDGLLAAGCMTHEPAFFSGDGVHPAEGGAKFIAKLYVQAAVKLFK